MSALARPMLCKTLNEKILSQTKISKWGRAASSALISSTTFSGGQKKPPLNEFHFIMTLRLTPYFMMDGNAKEAIRFYEKILDATIVSFQTYEEVMPSCPSAIKEQVAQIRITIF
jgi:hypothetical protein